MTTRALVKLHDGREVPSNSRDWQIETLAKYALGIKPLQARRQWLADLERQHPGIEGELKARMVAIHEATKRVRK